MQYLVDMKLVAYGRPTGGPQDGISFIEQYILPSLELCQKLEVEKKILAGGPANGAIRLVMIVNAESAQELDELIESLPIWPRMETTRERPARRGAGGCQVKNDYIPCLS